MQGLGFKRSAALIGGLLGLVLFLSLLPQIFETNYEGFYQVKQEAFSGDVSVRSTPGTYLQMGATITQYPISDTYTFASKKLNEEEVISDPITVAFNGGGRAAVNGTVKFRLSLVDKDQKLLHQDFRGYQAVEGFVRQTMQEVLNKTAATMKAEESYSSKLAEFTQLAEEQLINGVYETSSKQVTSKDADNNEIIDTIVEIKKDKDGSPIIAKRSALLRYKIEIINFTIKNFDYDEKTQEIIAKKQEAEQAKVVSRANAERAKQDAITAAETGKAEVAKAEAEALVAKKTAVIAAQQEYEVAMQLKNKAKEESEAMLLKQRAQAESNRLKVAAGLTPQEKAEYEMKTRIGVAAELAKTKFPDNMIISGGGSGSHGASSPMEALGMNALYDLSQKMSSK